MNCKILTSKQDITRDTEIKNKLTVTRGEVGGSWRGEKGQGFSEACRGIGSRVGNGDGWGAGSGRVEMETTVLEQQ